ncbi:MAG TPA: hypothetical protein VF204_00885 [Streptosporangiaceae bacterium]
MRWPYRPRATRRPVGLLLAPAAIIALATLTACGSLAANGQGSGSGGGTGAATGTAVRNGGLCASRGELTSLLVKRVGVLPLLRQEQSGVRARSRVAAVRARKVAAEICALPRAPRGARSCPIDIGITYKLYFTAGSRHFRTVTARVTGCQQVTGAGKPRTAAGHPGFWVALAKDVLLPPLRLPVNQGHPGQAGACHPASTDRTPPASCPGPRVPS